MVINGAMKNYSLQYWQGLEPLPYGFFRIILYYFLIIQGVISG